jgi:uncharacterized circularly permuted ATP-grasp superfamily protein/uncharacterized alpha-E superfamily protein
MAFDEMVDGNRGVRPSWRGLLGALAGIGREELGERAARLERLAAEEGPPSLLPGATESWRFDPIPLPLTQAEFSRLEAGLAQRARLLDAILSDVYGEQQLLALGALPPALVYANPGFLRPCRRFGSSVPRGLLRYYAADLLRTPDGTWQVVADRTDWADGLALALENRRRLARVVPEVFTAQQLCPLDPFVELWADLLHRLMLDSNGAPGGVALLTPGHAESGWYGHILLARELSCELVEGGDLTVRGEGLFLKTLRGLQPIRVLLRGAPGRLVDPLELAPDGHGVPGLLAAMRGSVRIVNDPGTGFAEAPALAEFLPALCQTLLQETLALPSVPTKWLGGDAQMRDAVLHDLDAWQLRSALEPSAPITVGRTTEAERRALLSRVAAAPWRFAANAVVKPSTAPCLGAAELSPQPVMLRMFLISDGMNWHAMPGGLGCVLPEGAMTWPDKMLMKDVWVLAEDGVAMRGPSIRKMTKLEIRRTSGDLPSRVADNFFWLGRYLERLESAARLLRISIARIARPVPMQHELAELEVLTSCLESAGLLNAETMSGLGLAGVGQALRRAASIWGSVHALLGRVSRVMGLLRDRVTGEMQSVTARGLQELEEAFARIDVRDDAQALDAMSRAMSRVLTFAATVSGLAAENMVRGGGRLFLDLGRRVERAQAIADVIACTLEFPGATTQPARVEHGLRLALELCDSWITYRSRYLAVVQPGPVLDLVLADEGNPRGLAFQLVTMQGLMHEIAGPTDQSLLGALAALRDEVEAMVRGVSQATDEARAALVLPERLRAMRDAVAELSDQLSRRYFAVLPTVRSIGLDASDQALRGAA